MFCRKCIYKLLLCKASLTRATSPNMLQPCYFRGCDFIFSKIDTLWASFGVLLHHKSNGAIIHSRPFTFNQVPVAHLKNSWLLVCIWSKLYLTLGFDWDFSSVLGLLYCSIPTIVAGTAVISGIPHKHCGNAIPTMLVGTVYFD